MNGGTIYEPGAPAGQESFVVGQAAGGIPTVTSIVGNDPVTLFAGPANVGVGAGAGAGVVGGVSTGEQQFQANVASWQQGISVAQKAIPAALGAAGLSVPGWLTGILGVAGAGIGIAQALGFGEGEGLFGLDILGGDTQYFNGVPLGGPGLAEPPAQYVIKEWSRNTAAGRVQYYKVQMPGWKKPRTFGYYVAFKRWVAFKAPHLAVIGKGLPSHRQLTRLRRNLSRHSADARTILKIVSPKSLKQSRRGRR